jgi:hypothetical protein
VFAENAPQIPHLLGLAFGYLGKCRIL